MNVLVLFAEVVPVLVLEASAALHGGEVARHVVDDVVAHVAAVLLRLRRRAGPLWSQCAPFSLTSISLRSCVVTKKSTGTVPILPR